MSNKHVPSTLRFEGQTILVTGTTNGLGRSAVDEFVKRGVQTLIMGVRNTKNGETVKSELQALSPKVIIHVLELDLESFESVVRFAGKLRQLAPELDGALLNAGLGGLEYTTCKSGHETIMQVNLYSNALLALEILPLLEKTARTKSKPSRLTWVGSFVQDENTLTKNPLSAEKPIMVHLDDPKVFDKNRYHNSKVLSTMFVERLAKRVDKNLVVFNEVSPGPVVTNFGARYPAYVRIPIAIYGCFAGAKTLAEGTAKYLHAFGVLGEESHGKYISNYAIASRAPFTQSDEGKRVGDKLFEEVLTACYEADPQLKHM